MKINEVKECLMEQLSEELFEDLNGLKIMGELSRKDIEEYLDDFNEWSKTAEVGDTYYAAGFSYEYCPIYEILIWANKKQREYGEPVYTTPTSSVSDLEAIKKECKAYNIENDGCIEIVSKDFEEPILHYENEVWTECDEY